MNIFKNLKLRTKLISSFVCLALAISLSFYLGIQLSLGGIKDEAIPTLIVVGQIGKSVKTVQAEALEFVATGEAEEANQFRQNSAELKTLVERLAGFLKDEPDKAPVFQNLARRVEQVLVLGQKIIESHRQTLEQVEALQPLEAEAETIINQAQQVVDTEMTGDLEAGDLDHVLADTLPTQQHLLDFVAQVRILRFEALKFVASGETENKEAFETAAAHLKQAQANLVSILKPDEPGEASLLETINELADKIEVTDRGILETHAETRSLLAELRVSEVEFDQAITAVESLATQNVEGSIAQTNRHIILVAVAIMVLAAPVGFFLTNIMVKPVYRLVEVAGQIGIGDNLVPIEVKTQDEIGSLAQAFNMMSKRVHETIATLEDRVRERTRALETTAIISRQLTTILNLDELLQQVVTSLQNAFGYHHVHIYLIDETTGELVMHEGTGLVGRQLKAKGHKLQPGQGIVGQVASSGEAFLAENVNEVTGFLANPLLAKTQAELAVPLRKGDIIVGVLDLQSEEINGFNEEDLVLVQSIADQVMVAIDNARLFQQTQAAVAEVEALNRRLTRETWRDVGHKVAASGYLYTKTGVTPAPTEWLPAMTAAVQQQTMAHHTGLQTAQVAVPLTLRGEIIGVIGVEYDASSPTHNGQETGQSKSKPWSEDELITIQAVAEQVALALDAARLTRDTERAAWRDHFVSESTAKVWSSADIEEVMKATVMELGNKLHASEVIIRLGPEADLVQV